MLRVLESRALRTLNNVSGKFRLDSLFLTTSTGNSSPLHTKLAAKTVLLWNQFVGCDRIPLASGLSTLLESFKKLSRSLRSDSSSVLSL